MRKKVKKKAKMNQKTTRRMQQLQIKALILMLAAKAVVHPLMQVIQNKTAQISLQAIQQIAIQAARQIALQEVNLQVKQKIAIQLSI
jgi:hypothetical protein